MQTKKGAGCLKCGKPGHWARDCPAPRSEWIQRDTPQQQTDADLAAPGSAAGNLAPLPIKRKRQPKPKLTFELLQNERKGLPVVFQTFAEEFKKKHKGRGREASDLRLLLDMYKQWQKKLFPSAGFDDFLEGVEKIGRGMEVKVEMRQLRQYVVQPLKGTQSQGEADDAAEPAMGANNAPSTEAAAAQEDDADEFNRLDDHLLEVEVEDEVGQQPIDEEAGEDGLMDDLMDEFEM